MQTLPRIADFVATDMWVRARFSSEPLTLDDGTALFQLLQALVEATQEEARKQIGEAVTLLPILSVRGGSIEVKLELKLDSESGESTAGVRKKLHAILMSVFLALGGDAAGTVVSNAPPQPAAVAVSPQCEEHVREAAAKAMDTWKFFGKGVRAEFEGRCGDMTIKTKIEVEPTQKG